MPTKRKTSHVPRVLFARIGWMTCYAGKRPGDEKPRAGGSHNTSGIGNENCNFKMSGAGPMKGFFQPYLRHTIDYEDTKINLRRIDPEGRGKINLDNVLVIFFAKHPSGGGQRIVGWYRNARVYGKMMDYKPNTRHYNLTAKKSDAMLLPPHCRTQVIPRGKGATGQSNAAYVFDAHGNRSEAEWIAEALSFVRNYRGENIAGWPLAQVLELEADQVPRTGGTAQQQGRTQDAGLRQAIEHHAMRKATAYYRKKGFTVVDTSANQPFDLLCTKKNSELRVEVKGTTSAGEKIMVTEGELKSAEEHVTDLFVVHGIQTKLDDDEWRCTGGDRMVLQPWKIRRSRAEATQYMYKLV